MAAMGTDDITAEMSRTRGDFHELLTNATVGELRQPSNGTRWTNEQLLFHMLFGYLVVRVLLFLVRGFSRLPASASRRFAAGLDAATTPFHVVNYVGSLGGARVLGFGGMDALMGRVIASLQASLARESAAGLQRGMHFPTGWDPYFKDFMTVGEVYHYATQHYDHHRRQLTLRATDADGERDVR
jgi:hypothetical protein